jgi:hypothetical protein
MKIQLTIILLSILIFNSFCIVGQDSIKTIKNNEFFFALEDISPVNISIKFKHQLSKNIFYKIGLVNVAGSSNTSLPVNSNSFAIHYYNFSIGLQNGIEFRKKLSEKFSFFHGPNLSFSYKSNITKTENPAIPTDERRDIIQSYIAGIPYTLGLLFQFNNHLLFSAEINPELSVKYSKARYGQNPNFDSENISSNFLFANKYGFISIAYRL